MFIKCGPTVINTDAITRADFTPATGFTCRPTIPATLRVSLAGRTETLVDYGEDAEAAWELICAKAEADSGRLLGLVAMMDAAEAEDDEDIEWDDAFGADDVVGLTGHTLDNAPVVN